MRFARVGGNPAISAERNYDGAPSVDGKSLHAFLAHLSGQFERFGVEVKLGFVGYHEVCLVEEMRSILLERRRIEDRTGSGCASLVEHRLDGIQRDLLLKQNDVRRRKIHPRNIARQHRPVGPGYHGYDIFPVGGHHDERNARRSRRLTDRIQVDPCAGQKLKRFGCECILANGAYHHDFDAGPARSQRLIGALTSRRCLELSAAYRFAGARNALNAANKIKIDRTNDKYHGPPPCTRGS